MKETQRELARRRLGPHAVRQRKLAAWTRRDWACYQADGYTDEEISMSLVARVAEVEQRERELTLEQEFEAMEKEAEEEMKRR